MSSETAIHVEGLGKQYRLGQLDPHRTLRESLRRWAVAPMRRALGHSSNTTAFGEETVWAVRDVSFDVPSGDVLGIIGRNGAGKSTLLKILTRITRPTTGRAEIQGRVGSLLEVGTGFHPELTGRENVFLNGAILGMGRAEIRRKFDQIVEFSGVKRFLDTPVKRYSSGMRVRLAFAVAAHLEPEILVIDEVLAVGDAEFQAKCLGKMDDVAHEGRTVLFVSHSMPAVRRLCNRVIWLADGTIRDEGTAEEITSAYLHATQPAESLDDLETSIARLPDDPVFRVHDAFLTQEGVRTTHVHNGSPVRIVMEYEVREPVRGLRVYFDLCDPQGDILIRSFHDEDADAMSSFTPGHYRSEAAIPSPLLAPREYLLVLRATIHNERTLTGEGLSIRLHVGSASRLNRGYPRDPIRSKLQPPVSWRTEARALQCANR